MLETRTMRVAPQDAPAEETDEEEIIMHEELDEKFGGMHEDAYGMGIAAIIKDTYWLIEGGGSRGVRALQFTSAIVLVLILIFMQAYLILELQTLVSSQAVTEARELYEKYEKAMYDKDHLWTNSAGHLRGVGGANGPYFHAENFDDLDKDLKDAVCSIPFSQPIFYGAILAVWTLTVMSNIKDIVDILYRLCWITPTVSTVKRMMKKNLEEKTTDIVGLTCTIKIVLVVLIGIPRVCMNILLLWRGSRYLAATFDFGSLLLNAVALEFILLLKDPLYEVIISKRNKMEVSNLRVLARGKLKIVSGMNYMESWWWLLLSLLYVVLYLWLQQTLPNYNWDVSEICKPYLEMKSRG